MKKKNGYIAFDLDGTLAHYESGLFNPEVVGEPIAGMVKIAKDWIAKGHEVRIITARMTPQEGSDPEKVQKMIGDWTEKHLGQRCIATNVKDFGMILLYDDRAVGVVTNTGMTVQEFTQQKMANTVIEHFKQFLP